MGRLRALRRQIHRFRRFMYERTPAGIAEREIAKQEYARGYADALEAANLKDVFYNGPGLRWSRNTWIIAKDTNAGMVQVGGLGAMGVGQMWMVTRDYHRDDPTFAGAPEVPYPGDSL